MLRIFVYKKPFGHKQFPSWLMLFLLFIPQCLYISYTSAISISADNEGKKYVKSATKPSYSLPHLYAISLKGFKSNILRIAFLPFVTLLLLNGISPRRIGYTDFLTAFSANASVVLISSSNRSVSLSDSLPDTRNAILSLKFFPIFRAIIFDRLEAP